MIDPIKRGMVALAETTRVGRSATFDRWPASPQPSKPVAQCLISALTPVGTRSTGKVDDYGYFKVFCDILRRNRIRTHACHSIVELRLRLARGLPTFLINLYGEDNFQIAGPEIAKIETQCLGVFNRAASGVILADKTLSERHLSKFGVPLPSQKVGAPKAFVRKVLGSGAPSRTIEQCGTELEEDEFARPFIDTRVDFGGKSYFTVIRVLCLNGTILHAYAGARSTEEGNANVHPGDTPIERDLIEYLHETLVVRNRDKLEEVADTVVAAVGDGFYGHDMLVERGTEHMYLCETGFKFDATRFGASIRRFEEVVSCHAILQDPVGIQTAAAHCFVDYCLEALGG